MKITTKILVACLPGIVTGALFAASTGDPAASKPNDAAMSKAKSTLAKLPLSFEPNRGQTDPRVQFLSRGPGYDVFFTKDETVLSLKNTATSNAVVRMKFVGGNTSAAALPLGELPGKANYLRGNDSSKWVTELPEYTKLRYQEVFPGIDVVYQGDQRQLRYDFVIKPGADASAIQMAFDGAEKVYITESGELALTIAGKTLLTKKPYTYQEDGGIKKEVASHYVLKNGRVTFELAKYDTTKELVIDPTVVFITFLGGALTDSVQGVAILTPVQQINPNQLVAQPSSYFVTGNTSSPNFPAVGGIVPNAQVGSSEVFVSKINFNGSTLQYSTYIGGNSQDFSAAIAIETVTVGCASTTTAANGCAVIAGQTFSANFPTVPFQGINAAPSLSGTNDAFVAKLNAAGTGFVYSVLLGGTTNDAATGVAVDGQGNVLVGGYTDSSYFICPGGIVPPVGNPLPACVNASVLAGSQVGSNDAFVVKVPANYSSASNFLTTIATTTSVALYGGFGADTARGIAYNQTNNMVYLAGDTTTGAQNYTAPNNKNLPGITNNTAVTGLPGPAPAKGGFVVAFDATTMIRTFASYVAVSAPNTTGTEIITGIAAEGGFRAACAGATPATCTATNVPAAAAPIANAYGNIGHVYLTGDTTSKVPTGNIAVVVPTYSCVNPLAAASTQGTPFVGPTGFPATTAQGLTIPAGCTTSLITQAPFNTNNAVVDGTGGVVCPYPMLFDQPNVLNPGCNIAAFVAIMDGALLNAPVPGTGGFTNIGNQIEYWAYYSSPNSSTVANAIAIDTNPTTATSLYSLGTYQQMYITGSTTNTVGGGGTLLPLTNTRANPAASNFTTPSEIFTTYNVGVTSGGGVGAWRPIASTVQFETDAYVARFNANGLAASTYGGQGATAAQLPAGTNGNAVFPFMGYGLLPAPVIPNDHSFLIHTPQFNFGEVLWSTAGTIDGVATSTLSTVGNAIAVDPTRAALVGGSTNNKNATTCTLTTTGILPCAFTTTNFQSSGGGQNSGGNDGWVSVIFFNDILTDAANQASANPFLTPGWPALTSNASVAALSALGNPNPSPTNPAATCTSAGNCSYIQTTPAPFGPTFDFAISDVATQSQTFRVLFTGQLNTGNPVLTQNSTPWYVPLDPRAGVNNPTLDNNLPGSGVAYYIPCANPAATGTLVAPTAVGGAPVASAGYYNNAYPAPGTAYGPQTCSFPTNNLYAGLPILYSGWPGLTGAQANKTLVTPGWLIVSQESIAPGGGVVRLQLDRRAAAGLLEGTYVAQFLVTTYDPMTPSQWPPCGPTSQFNPFFSNGGGGGTCVNPNTPVPADNASVLVTVRLIVRPTLFLSRNSGILTGVTSNLGSNPLSGPGVPGNPPTGNITIQQGTSPVPDWWYTGLNNDTSAWPVGQFGLATLVNAGTNGFNSGPPICSPFRNVPGDNNVPGTTWPSTLQPVATAVVGGVTIPCPVSPFAPNVWGTTPNPGYGAAVYAGNGPGDFSGGPVVYSPAYTTLAAAPAGILTAFPIASTPNMTFLYDEGTVFNVTTGPLSNCSNNTPCNLGLYQPLSNARPDAPGGLAAGGWNSLWQGGQDPVTQRNDATVHDYYVTAEGQATISVGAINCTNWSLNNHVQANGNWLAVQIGSGGGFVPICTDLTKDTIGTVRAPATGCPEPGAGNCTHTTADAIIGDDVSLPGAVGGQKIPLDFKTFAFSNRPAMNGIPTTPSLYTADVYVWSTRAKNSVPGYCLGASMPSSSTVTGADPIPLCVSTIAPASSSNPNPLVTVTLQQMFRVSLFVFDTTQVIQISPETCPAGGITGSISLSSSVVFSENLNTGNIAPPFGPGTVPNYPNFGGNATGAVEWSLLPFQTTGTNITTCVGSTSTFGAACAAAATTPNAQGGNASGGNTGVLTAIPLPLGVTVDPQTLQDYNACRLPTGKFNGSSTFNNVPVNGSFVPGIGTITQTGPIASTSFVPANNGPAGTNQQVTIYTCRPTVAPAWLNSPLYPGNSVAVPGSPEQYSNGNGPFGGPLATAVTGCVAPGSLPCVGGQGPVPSTAGLTCPLGATVVVPPVCPPNCPTATRSEIGLFRSNSTLLDSNGTNVYDAGTDRFNAAFFVTGSVGAPAQATDVAVAGDWLGTGHASVGVYRPTTGQWFLDTNNNGIYDAGDAPAFGYGGVAGDKPVVGDWNGLGRTCVGIFRQGFFWILDLNCNQAFDAADATFPFGGITGDVPVTGNWTGTTKTRVGVVRSYAPGGVVGACNATTTVGCPFYWVFDGADANAGSSAAAHQPAAGSFAFGGLFGDIYVTGDWVGNNITRAGIYRQGNWLEDVNGAHTYDTFYQFGGVPTDQPIVGKW